MKMIKRIISGVVIFVSLLWVLLCLAGIVGVWLVNGSLTESLTGTLDQVESVLVFTRRRLDQEEADLSDFRDSIDTFNQTVTEAGEQAAEKSPTLTLIINTVSTELAPEIETTAEIISTIRGTILSTDSTLKTMNSIPFVSVPTLPMEQLATIDQKIQDAVTSVKTLGETAKKVEAGTIEHITSTITTQMELIDAQVEQVQTSLFEFNATLTKAEHGVVAINARIPGLIDWGSVLATLTLLWISLAQGSLLYLGWFYLKTGTLPVINT